MEDEVPQKTPPYDQDYQPLQYVPFTDDGDIKPA